MVNSSTMEIATIEMIKPSSPTPSHLRKYNLSFLDQLAPPIYIHIILYYEACHDPLDYSLGHEETSLKLRRSLSDIITTYYPLAGRIRDNSWVDCDDAGVEYVETRFSDDHLRDIVKLSKIEDLGKYVPGMPRGGQEVPLAVQVNFFDCGGIAVGVCMSHKLADAASLVTFVNAWASSCHTEGKTVCQPAFGLASRFPSADFSWFPPPIPPPGADGLQKILTKRYVFDKKTITALRKVAVGPHMENPSRVEAVSAFIWKHYIEATTTRDKNKAKNTIFTATHAVDIRPRANPPLPRHVYGNACARAMAMVNGNNPSEERACTYHDLAIKLRHAIRKVDNEYVKKLENGDSFLKYYSENEENDPCFKDGKTRFDICGFTSWFQLPAYDTDYGWGKPVYVSIIGVPHKNLIFLLGTKSGDAIEAWVSMAEEDMAEIDTNYQLLCTNTLDIYQSGDCAPANHLPTGRNCQEV